MWLTSSSCIILRIGTLAMLEINERFTSGGNQIYNANGDAQAYDCAALPVHGQTRV